MVGVLVLNVTLAMSSWMTIIPTMGAKLRLPYSSTLPSILACQVEELLYGKYILEEVLYHRVPPLGTPRCWVGCYGTIEHAA